MRYNAIYSIIPGLMLSRNYIENFYECLINECYYSNLVILIIAFFLTVLLTLLAVNINLRFAKVGVDILGLFSNFNRSYIQK